MNSFSRWTSNIVVNLLKLFVAIIRRVPLFGELAFTDNRYILSAWKEWFWITIAATLPIWFFPLAAVLMFRGGQSFQAGVLNSISQGDLYIYSAAIVGPILFALTTNYAEWNSENKTAPRIGQLTFLFPYGAWFTGLSFAISVFSALFFGIIRYRSTGQIVAELNTEILVPVSIGMYILANICMYLVTVYRNALVNTAASTSTDERAFVEQFLKGQNNEQ